MPGVFGFDLRVRNGALSNTSAEDVPDVGVACFDDDLILKGAAENGSNLSSFSGEVTEENVGVKTFEASSDASDAVFCT